MPKLELIVSSGYSGRGPAIITLCADGKAVMVSQTYPDRAAANHKAVIMREMLGISAKYEVNVDDSKGVYIEATDPVAALTSLAGMKILGLKGAEQIVIRLASSSEILDPGKPG